MQIDVTSPDRRQKLDRPLVVVVLLNWNNYDATSNCLNSIARSSYPNLKTVIVDNASTDGSGARLASDYPWATVLFNPLNAGFARGCNVGIRYALCDAHCKFVLLLNNDCVVTAGFLEPAVEEALANPRVGLVGGKMLFSPESKRIWYAGGQINRILGRVSVRGSLEIDRGQYDQICDVGFVTGALMLISRTVLDHVGLLPEEYFFGTEEYDYCLTVTSMGYSLLFVPDFIVYHPADGSHSNHDPKYVYNGYRNKLIMQQKHLRPWQFTIWKAAFSLYAKWFASARRERHIANVGTIVNDQGPRRVYHYAINKAIKDHGRGELTEETLKQFEDEVNAIFL